ncbi:MAG TPA: nucleotidyltransferase domain-containing protein [Polyangiaceae bacterium]
MVQAVPEALRKVFGAALVAVALFGSRARGDSRADSDLDFYVLVNGLPADPFERARVLSNALPSQVAHCLNVLARTVEEFETDITPLHLDLAVDARILFDTEGYLASRLEMVRRRIREAGLERKPDLVWRWQTTPRTCDWSIRWDGVRR